MELGERVRIEAREAPVKNVKEGVALWNVGDRTEVVWSAFWQGRLECGAILVPGEAEALPAESGLSAGGPKARPGQKREEAGDGGGAQDADLGGGAGEPASDRKEAEPAAGEEAAEAPGQPFGFLKPAADPPPAEGPLPGEG